MGIMSVLAEMHGIPDFKLNLKFEIEVLCKQLEIQLSVSNHLPILGDLQNHFPIRPNPARPRSW